MGNVLMFGALKYLCRVKITDLHFSGAVTNETLSSISLSSVRARFWRTIARSRDLLGVNITISSAYMRHL